MGWRILTRHSVVCPIGKHLTQNPYKSPEIDPMMEREGRTHWYHSFVAPIAIVAFWAGVASGVLGSLMTFLPGDEVGWFAFTSIFIAAGLFAKGYKYKTAAAILLVLCFITIYDGYIRGIEYKSF